ncbi:MAG TPA: hypothetical protein VFB85_14160 [Vicinamibacterales bacterium]|jgi:hypothetical protein|nr:hypothetical protein [Vicinamibacterales bacterium]
MVPQEFLVVYLIANVVGLVLLELGYFLPRVARWAWVGIFVWAATVNTITAATEPWVYLAYGGLTPSTWYQAFIFGWFSRHIAEFVLTIAVGQLVIAILLARDGRARRIGVIGATIFLLAIAPLGVGSGFPFSLSAIASLLIMERRLRPLRQGSPASQFVPAPDSSDAHEIVIHAPAAAVFECASNVDLGSLPLVRAIFWLRSKIIRDRPVDRVPQGIVAEMRSLGWGVLRHEPGRLLVFGAATRPWQKNATFAAIAPEAFRTFAEPNLVKIVWTLEVEPLGPMLTRLRTETRAEATDAHARRIFTLYWVVFCVGIHFIRWNMLRAIRREAERGATESTGGNGVFHTEERWQR